MDSNITIGASVADSSKKQSKARKRNRVPISCTICRRRKVKCDKGKPTCNNCKKNGVQHLCYYLQPTWAKDLGEDELKISYSGKDKDRNDHSDTDSINKDEEIQKLRQTIQDLEKTVVAQRQQISAAVSSASSTSNSGAQVPTVTAENTPVTYIDTPRGSTAPTSTTSDYKRVPAIPDNPYTIGLNEIDLVKNFNILYTSKRNAKNQFPIIYQISTMSWLFIIKNDSYLNDLWIKIFNLRKIYEQQYTVTDGNESTKKILELSKQTNNFITNIKNSSVNFATVKDEELDFNNFDFKTNQPKPQECPVTKKSGECPVNHDYEAPVPLKRTAEAADSEETADKCPVTGSAGKCPVQHPDADVPMEDASSTAQPARKLATFKKLPQATAPTASVLQCPMIRHDEGLKQLASEQKCPMLFSDWMKLAEDEDNEDSKVCPLMIGDAKTLFRERLQNFSGKHTENGGGFSSQPANECPVVGCESSATKRRKTNSKKIKTIALPTDIKSMNFGNPKEVISVFERHLPSKKVAWLLINRFFDKLYLHLPIIDEYSFRERVAKIIGSAESSTGQKIKFQDLGTDYNEDFLTLCLMIIILRLSWLTLPSNLPKKFSQTGENSVELTSDEKILIKPENFVSMVLIDLIKEIFTDVRILSTPSVVILQVGMFLKYYNVLAPEDGFELDDSYNGSGHSNGVSPDKEALNLNSSVFLNSLISLAKTIGLNRDPLNFKNFQSSTKDESVNIHLFRRRHLWRKMWYSLINMNVLTNISLGDYSKHLNIEIDDNGNEAEHGNFNDYWDTKRPSSVEFDTLQKCFPDYNGKTDVNCQRELKVIKLMDLEYKINILIYKGMKVLANVKTLPLKSEVDVILNQLTALVHDESEGGHSGKFRSGLTCAELLTRYDKNRESELSASARIFEFKLFLIIKMLMFVLNYILFLNYELKLKELLSENNLDMTRIMEDPSAMDKLDPQLVEAIEYNKQIFDQYFERTLLLAIDNYNIFVQFFDNSHRFFPDLGGELLIYPFLMILNHRSKQFIISLVLRLQQNDPVVSQILVQNGIHKEELLNKLFGYLKIFLGKLDKLTKHYYYAWRLKKLMKFFYNVLISSSKLFTANYTRMLARNGSGADQCPVLQDIKTSSVPILPNQRKQALLAREKERKAQAEAAIQAQIQVMSQQQQKQQQQQQQQQQQAQQQQQQQPHQPHQQPHQQANPHADPQRAPIEVQPDGYNNMKQEFTDLSLAPANNGHYSRQQSMDGLQIVPEASTNGGNGQGEYLQPPSEFATQILGGLTEDFRSSNQTDTPALDLFDELILDNFPINGDRNLFGNNASGPDYFGNFSDQAGHSYGVNEIDFTNVDLNTLPAYPFQSLGEENGEMGSNSNHDGPIPQQVPLEGPPQQQVSPLMSQQQVPVGVGDRNALKGWFQSFH